MHGSISKWLALGLLVLLLWVARSVLAPFVVAGILAYILNPVVDELTVRLRIRRTWVALAVFAAGLGLVTLGAWLLGARLVGEVRALGRQGPDIFQTIAERLTGGQQITIAGEEISPRMLADRARAALDQELGNPTQALTATRLAVDVGLNVLLVFLALAYLLVDGHRLQGLFMRFVPLEHRPRVAQVSAEIRDVLGRYLRGQMLLVLLMSSVTFVMLEWVFHLPYALWVAILTGVLELIPLLGPVVAGAIACAVGFTQGGPPEAAWLALMYVVLRETEDQVVMPQVIGRAVHVHPLLTIFAVLTGERVAGVLGMVLAVPIAAAANIVLDYAYPPVPAEEQ